MNYLRKHWRGELSLATSFWLNMFLLNIVFSAPMVLLMSPPEYLRTDNIMLFALLYLLLHLFAIYPWQVIGTWRSANNHILNHQRKFWARFTQVLLVLGLLSTIVQTVVNAPVYSEMFKFATRQSGFNEYTVAMTADGKRVYFKGYIGPGSPQAITKLLKANPAAEGIILDSPGGLVKEAMVISRIVKRHLLNTYTLDSCVSACTIIFIAGEKRYVGESANLGFHGFSSVFDGAVADYSNEQDQRETANLYREAGVSETFIEHMFSASKNDMWYPAFAELMENSVVHGETSTVEIAADNKHGTTDKQEIEGFLLEHEAYRLIKQYEPVLYQELLVKMENLLNNGASMAELQRNIGNYVEQIAVASMVRASDETLEKFVQILISSGRKIVAQDAFACMQYFFPDQYGNADIRRFLERDDFDELNDVFAVIIRDAYTRPMPDIDIKKGETVINDTVKIIGDDVRYLDPANTHGAEDYKKACDVMISFYEEIMRHDRKDAVNALRYLFASE
jgi:ATP-dependent protease ClpP protease subunit